MISYWTINGSVIEKVFEVIYYQIIAHRTVNWSNM